MSSPGHDNNRPDGGAKIHDPGVERSAVLSTVEVAAADIRTADDGFMVELSTEISQVSPDDLKDEIERWLDRLAHNLGAERCSIGEFRAEEEIPRFLLQWSTGKPEKPLKPEAMAWIREQMISGQVVAISTLDQLPGDAAAQRAQLEELGIRSGLWVPMLVENSVVGGIGLNMLSRECEWPAEVIQRCKLIAHIFGNAFLRRSRAREIAERTQFESLVADIVTRFMNVDENIDKLADTVMGELGAKLQVDRVGLLEVDATKGSLTPTRQWIGKGVKDDVPVQYVDVSAHFPWMTEKILAGEGVLINTLDDFPDEAGNERKYCEQLEIRSFIMIPAQLGSQVTAALALDSIHEHRAWDPHIVQRLEFVAGIIAAGLNRTIAQRRIDALHEFEQVISRVSHRFVNLPPESVDAEIEGGLGMIAEVLDSDLTVLIQVDANNTITVTHESNSERFEGYYFKGADVRQAFPWLADRMQRRETISISNLSDFPAAAANEMEAMKQAGLEAVLFEPVEIRGELAGYIVIDSVHSREWSKHDRQQLQLLGGVFCESLARQRAELGLASAFAEINALKEQLQHENMHLRNEIELTHNHGEIIGDSPALRKALEKVVQVAATDSTVLITGETGTGKELIARAIHNNSSRRDKLMVKVNCAALPSSLVEAELFGREKGAYTGALNRELGRFEIADGSTIFLDEIGELSMELQAKLLRVLQDGEFERLGSSKTLQVDARVLTATNRDLAQAVADKEFREDLYYRLNVFPIEVPPLRMRAEDIPQLVWAFVQEFSASMGKSIESIPNATMEALTTYDWPGNVREVRNIVERAMIVSSGRVLEVGLPIAAGNREDASEQSRQSLAEVERNHILAVVKSTGWRIRGPGGAASILGLKPTTLEARMKRLGLERPEPS